MVLACCGMIICVMCAEVKAGRTQRLAPSALSPKHMAGGRVGSASLCVMGCSRQDSSCSQETPKGWGRSPATLECSGGRKCLAGNQWGGRLGGNGTETQRWHGAAEKGQLSRTSLTPSSVPTNTSVSAEGTLHTRAWAARCGSFRRRSRALSRPSLRRSAWVCMVV